VTAPIDETQTRAGTPAISRQRQRVPRALSRPLCPPSQLNYFRILRLAGSIGATQAVRCTPNQINEVGRLALVSPLLSGPWGEFVVHPLYDHARMLRQAMIQRDRIELFGVAVAGAVLGIVTGVALGHEWLGTLTWALIGAVVVSGVVYVLQGRR